MHFHMVVSVIFMDMLNTFMDMLITFSYSNGNSTMKSIISHKNIIGRINLKSLKHINLNMHNLDIFGHVVGFYVVIYYFSHPPDTKPSRNGRKLIWVFRPGN